MSTRVRSLACLFFLAHFAASVYVVLTDFGAGMAFSETEPPLPPSHLLELSERVLTFPIFPIVLSLPSAVSQFIPLVGALMVNSLLCVGIGLLLASKRVRHARAA
jgi:hypothetical protein